MPGTLPLGRIVATSAVAHLTLASPAFKEFIVTTLRRHAAGDWGEVDVYEQRANEAAVVHGNRVMSSYLLPAELVGIGPSLTLWLITEADRSATTALWPSDY